MSLPWLVFAIAAMLSAFPALAQTPTFTTLTTTGAATVGGTLNTKNINLAGFAYARTTVASGAYQGWLDYVGDLSGTLTGGNPFLVGIRTNSDNANYGAAGLTGLNVNLTGGGASSVGNRQAISFQTNYSGGPLNAGLGVGGQIIGIQGYTQVSGGVGGTNGAAYGAIWGGVTGAFAQAGATYYNELTGHEFDVGMSSGAIVGFLQGVKIVNLNGTSLVGDAGHTPQPKDYAFAIASSNVNGFQNGISFGSPDDGGAAPVAASGTLIATKLGATGTFTTALGVDFTGATFTNAAWKSTGATISGTGAGQFVSLDATPIGGTTPAAGSFTTLRNNSGWLSSTANNNAAMPSTTNGMAIGWNYNSQETDLVNTFPNATPVSHTFWQNTGASLTRLVDIGPTGNLKAFGGVTATGYTAGVTAGVSCAAGTVSAATMVVTAGIVTHC